MCRIFYSVQHFYTAGIVHLCNFLVRNPIKRPSHEQLILSNTMSSYIDISSPFSNLNQPTPISASESNYYAIIRVCYSCMLNLNLNVTTNKPST